MLAIFTLGLVTGAWLGSPTAAGVAFVTGSAVAARYARRTALLTVAVSPPLLFFVVLACVKVVTASGNTAVSAVAGIALALAETALWLFTGTALCLIISWARGLPHCVRDLHREVRRDRAHRAGGRPPGAGPAGGARAPGMTPRA